MQSYQKSAAARRTPERSVKGMPSDKNIPPDVQIERDAVTIRCGERETVATKDGIRIRER